MLNFLICDDNEHSIENLKSKLETLFIKYDLDWKITHTATNASDLLICIRIKLMLFY